jgi:glycosyltransferase
LKISIITATFNSSQHIVDCVKSISSQSYSKIEHIIVDSCSADNTVALIKSHTNHEIKIIQEKDNGIYDALNKGIKSATGDILGFLHSDDTFASNDVLSTIANVFLNDKSVSAVYGDLNYVNRKNTNKTSRRWVSSKFSSKLLSFGWMPPHPTLYVRKECFEEILGFSNKYKISSDYDFILRLFSNEKYNTYYIPKILVNMRAGGVSNKSIINILQKSLEDFQVLRNNGFSYISSFTTLFLKNFCKLNQFFR